MTTETCTHEDCDCLFCEHCSAAVEDGDLKTVSDGDETVYLHQGCFAAWSHQGELPATGLTGDREDEIPF